MARHDAVHGQGSAGVSGRWCGARACGSGACARKQSGTAKRCSEEVHGSEQGGRRERAGRRREKRKGKGEMEKRKKKKRKREGGIRADRGADRDCTRTRVGRA